MSGQWHRDPTSRYEWRWWDGARWTEHVAVAGNRYVDHLAASPPIMDQRAVSLAVAAPTAEEPAPNYRDEPLDEDRLIRPIRLHRLPTGQRRAATIALAVLILALTLLIRPIGWKQVGGQQELVDGLLVSRLSMIVASLGIAAVGAALTWLALSSTRIWARLPAAPAAALVLLQLRGVDDIFSLLYQLGGPAARAAGALGVLTTFFLWAGSFIAVTTSIIWRGRGRTLIAVALGLGGCIPVCAYLASLARPSTVTLPTGQVLDISNEIGIRLLLTPGLLIYLIPLYVALSVAGFAGSAAEWGLAATRPLNARRWTLLVIVVVKLSYVAAGFADLLPTSLGARFPWWGTPRSAPVGDNVFPSTGGKWLMTLIVMAALLALARLKRRPGSGGFVGSDLLIACIAATQGVIQTVIQTMHAFLPQVVPNVSLAKPLYFSGPAPFVLAGVLLIAGALWRWKRSPATRVAFVVAAIVNLPSTMLSAFADGLPIPTLWHYDLVLTAGVLVLLLVPAWHGLLRTAVPLMIALTAVAYGMPLVSALQGRVGLGLSIAFSPLWYVFINSDPIRNALRSTPGAVGLTLGVPALVGLIAWAMLAGSQHWAGFDPVYQMGLYEFPVTTVVAGSIVVSMVLSRTTRPRAVET